MIRKPNFSGKTKRIIAVSLALGLLLVGGVVLTTSPMSVAADSFNSETITDGDLLVLLAQQLGGRDLAVPVFDGMSEEEKRNLRSQAARISAMAQVAEREGISQDPEVALALKWGTRTLLAEAWKKRVLDSADSTEKDLRAFYEAHLERYVGPSVVRYRQVLYPSDEAARRARGRLGKNTLDGVENRVDVDWIEYDKLVPELAAALREASLGTVVGPVKTPKGYMLCEVLERQNGVVLPFERVRGRVREDFTRSLIEGRLR